MNRFATLLRREWMQHHRGWLLLAGVPALVALLAVPFGQVQIDGFIRAPMLASMAVNAYLMGLLAFAVVAMLLQAPGMARRDQQDRSIEFWLSLPTSHLHGISATLLMHLLLMPALVLVLSAVVAQLVAAMLVIRVLGAEALSEIALVDWLAFSAIALLRQSAGLVVGVLWLSPLILLAMAASSWLKGWGVPALIAALAILGLILQQMTGQMQIWQLLIHWWMQARVALLPLTRGDIPFKALMDSDQALPWFRDWLLHDVGQLLRDAASPAFALAILVAGCGFGLLVWRRARGGQ